MSVISVPMIYTVIAIICVAITGTVGVDPTTGPVGAQNGLNGNTGDGYECLPDVLEYLKSNLITRVPKCLIGALKLPSTVPVDFAKNDICCYWYMIFNIYGQWLARNCLKVSDTLTQDIDKVVTKCAQNGHQLSDRFCDKLLIKRPMSAECAQYIQGLATEVYTSRPSTTGPFIDSGDPVVNALFIAFVILLAIAFILFGSVLVMFYKSRDSIDKRSRKGSASAQSTDLNIDSKLSDIIKASKQSPPKQSQRSGISLSAPTVRPVK